MNKYMQEKVNEINEILQQLEALQEKAAKLNAEIDLDYVLNYGSEYTKSINPHKINGKVSLFLACSISDMLSALHKADLWYHFQNQTNKTK